MIKVKLIHSAWLTAPNGANTVMNSLLASKEQFARNAIEISSLSPDTFVPRSFSTESQAQLKYYWRSKLKKLLKEATRYSTLASDLMIYLTEIRPAKKIVEKYVESNPDSNEIAFFHALIPCYYFLKLRRTNQRTVLVLHTNGDNYKMLRIYYPKLKRSFVYKKLLQMEEYVMEHVDKINFVASMVRENFLQSHPKIDYNKVSFVYNGIRDEIRSIQSRRHDDILEICCIASISRRKGQLYIIEALKMYNKSEIPNVHFTFVGDGTDRKEFEEEVKRSELEKYITFAGISQNVDEFLCKSDIFILPSEDEGLPMAIIEAMRASLPIVSTPVGGIPEMVENGRNGLLIQPKANDVFEFLNKVDSYNWHLMGLNARKTFEEKFTINKMVDGYVKIFSHLS